MTYSQPDPAEETTAGGEPEELDDDDLQVEGDGDSSPALEIDSDDVPTEDA
jgi:hypothetical protein